jgi:hypothetical protein
MTKGLYLRFSVVRDNEAYCGNLGQIFWAEDYLWVVPFLHRLVRGLASLRLNPRLVNLRFVVDKVALAWVFLGVLRFNSRQWLSINSTYSFFYLLPSCRIAGVDSVWEQQTHWQTDTHTDTLRNRHTDILTRRQKHTDKLTHTHTHTHIDTDTLTQRQRHTDIQTHWQTDTHTHTHIDTDT